MIVATTTARLVPRFFVDPALRVGVICEVAFNGVLTLQRFEVLKARLSHGDPFRSADQRITNDVGIGRSVPLRMLCRHDVLLKMGHVVWLVENEALAA